MINDYSDHDPNITVISTGSDDPHCIAVFVGNDVLANACPVSCRFKPETFKGYSGLDWRPGGMDWRTGAEMIRLIAALLLLIVVYKVLGLFALVTLSILLVLMCA